MLKDQIEHLEKDEIMDALRESNWIMARAARMLGITERMISYKIKKYGIKRELVFGAETGHGSAEKSIG